jgi:hypothetical protein
MPAAGDPVYASDINTLVARETLTSDSTTWTSTESGSVFEITADLVSGRLYRIDLTCHVSTDAQTFAITSANTEMAIIRIKEDDVSGTQLCGDQIKLGHTSANGFKLSTWVYYTAAATGPKTFVVTGQRNGAASGGNQRLRGFPLRPCILTVRLEHEPS